ncbi:MAG: alpha/beta hydrolase family esterase [Acidimicrobiales bacterium]
MRRLRAGRVVLVVAALAVAGCSRDETPGAVRPAHPAIEHRTIDMGGAVREYRLFTPAAPDGDLPLVVALHGGGNRAQSLVEATQLDAAATANGFLVAYPEAAQVWNGGFCCTGGRGDAADDVRFLDRVIMDVAANRGVDPRRVYAVGVSAGGVMAYRLACDLAPRLAGIGSVAGTMLLDDCHPARAVTVVEIHGTADGIVPFDGGSVISPRVATAAAPPVPAVVERWASLDQCPGPPTTTVNGSVTTTAWNGCDRATSVRLVAVGGGGHTWFATEFGLPDGAVDATDTFLAAFGLLRAG